MEFFFFSEPSRSSPTPDMHTIPALSAFPCSSTVLPLRGISKVLEQLQSALSERVRRLKTALSSKRPEVQSVDPKHAESRRHSWGGELGGEEDATIEDALYKCLLKPLKECIYSHLLDFHSKDGTLRKLRDNQHTMKEQSLAELKVRAGVPDTGGMDKIQQNFGLMHAAYSPKKKVMQLLKVCKLIYEAMNHTAGKTEIYGADDFLPVLIYVLLGSDITSLQLDVEYMMELLDPTQLQGEGGYYLTTFFGALHHIANVQSTPVTGQMSKEAQRSIHQWQRRRTIHHSHGPRRSTQNVLFVSFQEPFNNEKTIIVPADTTTASVCALCSQKYQIQDSEAYGLFLVRNNELQLLDDNSCPQKVKVDFLKRGEGSLAFVYRLKDGKLTGRSASLSDLEGTRL